LRVIAPLLLWLTRVLVSDRSGKLVTARSGELVSTISGELILLFFIVCAGLTGKEVGFISQLILFKYLPHLELLFVLLG